jgi:HAD superfamily hydrolase (TIGR01509 family)
MPPDATESSLKFRLPRRPKAVVFDLDGTIIDSEALVLDAYMAASKEHRIPLTHEQFLTFVGHNREASERRMREYFGADFPLQDFYASVAAYIGDRHAPMKDGVTEVMDELDAMRAPYALATSSGPGWVEKHFNAHRLGQRFRGVVTREDVKHGKPHPEPYLKASTMLAHLPADILAFEDSPTGVASAHAAGLMTILIPDLIQPDEETRGRALHVARSMRDVLEMLKG